MNDFSVILYGVFFFAVAGATFAFMWKSMTFTINEMNKPIKRSNLHPEMRDIESGEELLVFNPEKGEDGEDDVIIVRK